ncbi:hypothetical protein [Streptomyces sp. NPDC014894]|uniref:hypothetical protein n=1 Tax=Streptomyces sp. NPDC014894 TaxID=3364931 RepID=UPI003702E65B
MRIRTRAGLAALPLALAVALTGCGSDGGGERKVASAAKGGGQASGAGKPSAEPSLSAQEMGLKFAACMRKNGVEMEDPVEGRLTIRQQKKGGNRATVEKAMKACREFQPQGLGPGGKADPKVAGNMRQYARCMRENGVEDFPDPDAGSGGIKVDGRMVDDPDFKKADEQCKGALGGGGLERAGKP